MVRPTLSPVATATVVSPVGTPVATATVVSPVGTPVATATVVSPVGTPVATATVVSPVGTPVVIMPVEGGEEFWDLVQQREEKDTMTAEWIAAGVGVLVSLLLEVVPGLAGWWEGLGTWKRLGWLLLCVVLPLVVMGAACLGLDLGVGAPACEANGVVEALKLGFTAYFAAQGTYATVGRVVRGKRQQRMFNG